VRSERNVGAIVSIFSVVALGNERTHVAMLLSIGSAWIVYYQSPHYCDSWYPGRKVVGELMVVELVRCACSLKYSLLPHVDTGRYLENPACGVAQCPWRVLQSG
jgi:hypothetical protein